MAFSVNNRLITFAQQDLVIGYNEKERERVSNSLQQLERILAYKLGSELKGFLTFGSLTRNTILPRKFDPKSDVDLMVVFDTSRGRYKPATYREKLKRVISGAYPNSLSQRDFPAVKLELNHIMFDIVPAYIEEFWGTYYIPDLDNEWMSTAPNDINAELEEKNQSYGNNIVRQVIRLCKHWNAGAGYPFESYKMEKRILGMIFIWGNNLFNSFLSVLESLASDKPGVRQALKWIERYGDDGDHYKQFEWLQKLLPGLH